MNQYIEKMNDQLLIQTLSELTKSERTHLCDILIHLAEVDRRKLYAKSGYPSLYQYCLEKFYWSESECYLRIQAARMSRTLPELLDYLRAGKINLTTIKLISPYIGSKNKNEVLQAVEHKTRTTVEWTLAKLFPNGDEFNSGEYDSMRRMPSFFKKNVMEEIQTAVQLASKQTDEKIQHQIIEKTAEKISKNVHKLTRFEPASLTPNKSTELIQPLSTQQVKIEFRASEKFAHLLKRAKEVLGHKYPHITLEDIFIEALELLLEKKDPQRKIKRHSEQNEVKRRILTGSLVRSLPSAKAGGPRDDSRYIPQAIQREVYQRDHGQCTYKSPEGKKCGAKSHLQIDHIQPWGLGGTSELQNLRLLCRTHNQWRSEQTFKRSSHLSFTPARHSEAEHTRVEGRGISTL